MAHSKCPKCEFNKFELSECSPKTANFKIMLVQCSSCGTVVGTTNYFNTANLLGKIAEKLNIDESELFR